MTNSAEEISYKLNKLFMHSLNDVTLFDDVITFLQYLKQTDIQIALATNGSYIRQKNKILSTGLGVYFANIYISGQIGCAKPDKLFFDSVLNDLHIKASEAIMIGNSIEDDYRGAQGSGIDFVLIDRYNINGDFEDTRVSNLSQFKSLLFNKS